ncbi:MFS transporter [Micromonospora andamanensis]|uniref:MFS transporter n=1 Tax=Micromonospora andamanensis TaxID=1287068 RepID=A0ABQ4HZM9_9ACTN|nr:MFS transporter [Micromonospora andamanensis]GIJ11071.1 MFS transporter [Micromonospora andamanensis]
MLDSRTGLAPRGVVRPHLPLGVVVAISCLAQFTVVLDATIVTLALPDMRASLDMSASQQQWVVSGYLIAFGGFLLLAARAGDLFGYRRVFLAGAVIFTLASLAGGLATSPWMLLVARVFQGLGAAALSPTSLNLITASHSDEDRRERAVTLWSLMGALSSVAGLILGGVLTAGLSWHWVMFVNVPPGLILLVAGLLWLLPDRDTGERRRLDLPGALTATLGIGALTYGFSEVATDGWTETNVLVALIAAAVLLIGFVAVEAKSRHPLIPLTIFRLRTVSIGNFLIFCMGVTMTAGMVLLSLYFQEALDYDPFTTGLSLLPMSAIVIAGGLGARQLLPRVGTRPLLLAGGLVTTVGLLWMTRMPAEPAYLTHVLGPTLVTGLGMSLLLPAATVTSTTGVAPGDDGAASGLLNTSRQIGGAVGLAVLVTIATTTTERALPDTTPVKAIVDGFHTAFLANAAVMLAATLVALALPRSGRQS